MICELPRGLYIAEHYGFCSGVQRAVDGVQSLLNQSDLKLAILHELVHNEVVVNDFIKKGVRIIYEITDAKKDECVIFSAHGVTQATIDYCEKHQIRYCDLTCPLVKKIHYQLEELQKNNTQVLLIGHAKHREIIGTLGQAKAPVWLVETTNDVDTLPDFLGNIAYLTQTTLAPEEIEPIIQRLYERYPQLTGGGNICYATRERQDAVRTLAPICDTFFVIGSPKSSNTQRLVELARRHCSMVIRINSPDEFSLHMLTNAHRIGLTAGASTPQSTISSVIQLITDAHFPIQNG